MVEGHCFQLVGKDIGAAVAIIIQASAVAATIARTSATMGQGGMSNFQGFQAHHPPTYMGGGVRPEKFQFLEKGQNRNFGQKSEIYSLDLG